MIDIKNTGFIDAIISAMIFGAMPLFTKSLFSFGLNPISSAFYRMSMLLVFIYLFAKIYLKCDMRLSKYEFFHFLIGAFSFVLTSTLLFSSYNYISVGASTSIHFVYPVIIFIAVSIIKKKIPNLIEVLCIIFTMIGLLLMTDFTELSNIKGIFFAVISAFTYAFYSIYLEKKVFSNMKPVKTLFYMNFLGAIILFIFSISTKNYIKYDFQITQWIGILLYSFVLTVGATFLYQKAVILIGATYTSILSTLEPITSILLGFFIFKETLSVVQIIAVIFIILSTFILIKSKK